MSEISNYKGDFYADLAQWVKAFTEGAERKRQLEESIRWKENEIRWIDRHVAMLLGDMRRRPSLRQLDHYRHERRRLELEIAFSSPIGGQK